MAKRFFGALKFWKKKEKEIQEAEEREKSFRDSLRMKRTNNDANEKKEMTQEEIEAEEERKRNEALLATSSDEEESYHEGVYFSDDYIVFEDENCQESERGWLSNYYIAKMLVKGKQYSSVHHYYLSQQFTSEEFQAKIRDCETIQAADDLISSNSQEEKDAEFESKREEVLRSGIEAKFQQHLDLQAKLFATEDPIVYKSTDDFWGGGEEGDGGNVLGQILSKVRQDLRMLKLKSAMQSGAPSNTPMGW